MNIAFVGVGKIGLPICERLIEYGHAVCAYDISAKALARSTSAGAGAASSAGEAAHEASVVFTCLPTPSAVVQALTADGAVFDSAQAGAIVVDLSTNDPKVVVDLAANAHHRGLRFADAPVSGGPPRAREGTLTVMVGASTHDFSDVEPLIQCFGSQIFHLGPVGAGNIAKLANNLVAMCNLAAANEAFMAVKRSGIPPERFLPVLRESSGGSTVLALYERKVLAGDFTADFTLDMAYKDLRLALEVGEKAGVPMSFGALLKITLEQARARGYGAEDVTAMVRGLEDVMADTVRIEP